MRIIFIRHGDPDYQNDALTEKGIREAKLLSERVAKWDNITHFYCSPLGRAQQTASYSLEKTGREAITYEWLKEFSYFIDDPVTGRHGVPWDFMPEYWTKIPQMYEKDGWKETAVYRSNPELLPAYEEVCEGVTPDEPDVPDTPNTGNPIPYIAVGGGLIAIAGVYFYSRKSNRMYKI